MGRRGSSGHLSLSPVLEMTDMTEAEVGDLGSGPGGVPHG